MVLHGKMTYQDGSRKNYRPWFTLRLRGAGGGAGTSIPRPFILNPHVFEGGGRDKACKEREADIFDRL